MYLYENNVVFFILVLEIIVTLSFIILEHVGYNRLLRECEKGEKDNLVIKNIKEGRVNVNSVDNYVNKYVSNFEFCGLKLYTLKRICGQLLNLKFITWCIVSIYGIYLEVSIKDVLWTTMLGILVVGVLFSIGYSVDNLKYEYIAKINLKNSLEEYIYFQDTLTCDEQGAKENEIITRREKFRKAIYASDRSEQKQENSLQIDNNGKYTLELNNDNLGYLSDYYKEESMDKKKVNTLMTDNVHLGHKEKDEEVIYNIMKEILLDN